MDTACGGACVCVWVCVWVCVCVCKPPGAKGSSLFANREGEMVGKDETASLFAWVCVCVCVCVWLSGCFGGGIADDG